jgi:hypothetical protein
MDTLSYALVTAACVLMAVLVVLACVPRFRKGWKDTSGAIGNAAQISSAIIAFFGFGLVIIQLTETRQKSANDALRAELGDARRLYVSYSASSLQYPELAEPNYNELMRDHWKYVRYKTYVAHMLWAYDDMLAAVQELQDHEALQEWVASFEADMKNHLRYVCQEVNDAYLSSYRPSLKRYLDRAKGEQCITQEPLEGIPAPSTGAGPG